MPRIKQKLIRFMPLTHDCSGREITVSSRIKWQMFLFTATFVHTGSGKLAKGNVVKRKIKYHSDFSET